MADKRATLTLKLGNKEVRYEAEREAVEAQLEHIVSQLLRETPAKVQAELTESPPATAAHPAAVPPPATPVVTEARLLRKLYTITDDGHLRLRKLPGRTADALLLVLYGMHKLQDRSWVHAPGMTSAARASGARFDRADRLLAAYHDLIEGFGKRRGKRYRLTAAGRDHCARLMEDLVGSIVGEDDPATSTEPVAEESATQTDGSAAGIPKKVTANWDGELLTVAEAAQQLGVNEAEIGKLRRDWQLLGLPGGDSKRRRFFYPAFQIDADRHEIYPQARAANLLVSRHHTSWGIAKWWGSVEPELGKKPMGLVGTPEADAVVRVARVKFGAHG